MNRPIKMVVMSGAALAALIGGVAQAGAAESGSTSAQNFTGYAIPGNFDSNKTGNEVARDNARTKLYSYESSNQAVCSEVSYTNGRDQQQRFYYTINASCLQNGGVNRVITAKDTGADQYDAQNKARAKALSQLPSNCKEDRTTFDKPYEKLNNVTARLYATCTTS